MPASKLVQNRIRELRRFAFEIAQQQKNCPVCGKKLLPTGKLSDVYNLVNHHLSEKYDHAKRMDRHPKGIAILHKSCHKSFTMKELAIWKNRKNVRGAMEITADNESELSKMVQEWADNDPSIKNKLKEVESRVIPEEELDKIFHKQMQENPNTHLGPFEDAVIYETDPAAKIKQIKKLKIGQSTII